MKQNEMGESAENEQEVIEELTGFPCASCGHQMRFDPQSGGLLCDYCKSEKPIPVARSRAGEYMYDPYTDKWDSPDWSKLGNHVLLCPACGAETLVPREAVTTACPFCDSRYVTALPSDVPVIQPEYMLPFAVSEEGARTHFLSYAGKRLYAPFGFKKKISRVKASGIYIPAFTYDTDTETAYSGQGGRRYTETYRTRVNGKTVTRTRTKIRWYPISGRNEEKIDDILTLASRKVDESLFYKIAPFSTKDMYPYTAEYLAGFFAERYSIGPTDSFRVASETACRSLERKVESDCGYDCYSGMEYRHHFRRVMMKHILLPVWFASYAYGKKKYFFLVNGETGRVAGRTPLSKLKIALTAFLGLCGAALVAYLIYRTQLG